MLSNGNHADHDLELEAHQSIILSDNKDFSIMPPEDKTVSATYNLVPKSINQDKYLTN